MTRGVEITIRGRCLWLLMIGGLFLTAFSPVYAQNLQQLLRDATTPQNQASPENRVAAIEQIYQLCRDVEQGKREFHPDDAQLLTSLSTEAASVASAQLTPALLSMYVHLLGANDLNAAYKAKVLETLRIFYQHGLTPGVGLTDVSPLMVLKLFESHPLIVLRALNIPLADARPEISTNARRRAVTLTDLKYDYVLQTAPRGLNATDLAEHEAARTILLDWLSMMPEWITERGLMNATNARLAGTKLALFWNRLLVRPDDRTESPLVDYLSDSRVSTFNKLRILAAARSYSRVTHGEAQPTADLQANLARFILNQFNSKPFLADLSELIQNQKELLYWCLRTPAEPRTTTLEMLMELYPKLSGRVQKRLIGLLVQLDSANKLVDHNEQNLSVRQSGQLFPELFRLLYPEEAKKAVAGGATTARQAPETNHPLEHLALILKARIKPPTSEGGFLDLSAFELFSTSLPAAPRRTLIVLGHAYPIDQIYFQTLRRLVAQQPDLQVLIVDETLHPSTEKLIVQDPEHFKYLQVSPLNDVTLVRDLTFWLTHNPATLVGIDEPTGYSRTRALLIEHFGRNSLTKYLVPGLAVPEFDRLTEDYAQEKWRQFGLVAEPNLPGFSIDVALVSDGKATRMASALVELAGPNQMTISAKSLLNPEQMSALEHAAQRAAMAINFDHGVIRFNMQATLVVRENGSRDYLFAPLDLGLGVDNPLHYHVAMAERGFSVALAQQKAVMAQDALLGDKTNTLSDTGKVIAVRFLYAPGEAKIEIVQVQSSTPHGSGIQVIPLVEPGATVNFPTTQPIALVLSRHELPQVAISRAETVADSVTLDFKVRGSGPILHGRAVAAGPRYHESRAMPFPFNTAVARLPIIADIEIATHPLLPKGQREAAIQRLFTAQSPLAPSNIVTLQSYLPLWFDLISEIAQQSWRPTNDNSLAPVAVSQALEILQRWCEQGLLNSLDLRFGDRWLQLLPELYAIIDAAQRMRPNLQGAIAPTEAILKTIRFAHLLQLFKSKQVPTTTWSNPALGPALLRLCADTEQTVRLLEVLHDAEDPAAPRQLRAVLRPHDVFLPDTADKIAASGDAKLISTLSTLLREVANTQDHPAQTLARHALERIESTANGPYHGRLDRVAYLVTPRPTDSNAQRLHRQNLFDQSRRIIATLKTTPSQEAQIKAIQNAITSFPSDSPMRRDLEEIFDLERVPLNFFTESLAERLNPLGEAFHSGWDRAQIYLTGAWERLRTAGIALSALPGQWRQQWNWLQRQRILLLVGQGNIANIGLDNALKKIVSEDPYLKVVFLDTEPNAITQPLLKDSRHFEFVPIADATDPETVLLATKNLLEAKNYRLQGAVAVYEGNVRACGVVLAKFKLPGISGKTALNVTDKSEMRQLWRQAGLEVPEFALANSPEEARDAVAALINRGLAAVIKPPAAGGQVGVRRIKTLEEFDRTFEAAMAEYRRSPGIEAYVQNPGSVWIVEQYIPSNFEVMVDTLTINGETAVINILLKTPTEAADGKFVEEIFLTTQGLLAPEDLMTILRTTDAAMKALSIRNGAGHLELRLIKRTHQTVAIPIEVGGRFGGGAIPYANQLARGFDSYLGLLRMALSQSPPSPIKDPNNPLRDFALFPNEGTAVAMRIIYSTRVGKIEKIELPALDRNSRFIPRRAVGATVVNPSNDYVGYLLVTASTPAEAARKVDTLAQQTRLVLLDGDHQRYVPVKALSSAFDDWLGKKSTRLVPIAEKIPEPKPVILAVGATPEQVRNQQQLWSNLYPGAEIQNVSVNDKNEDTLRNLEADLRAHNRKAVACWYFSPNHQKAAQAIAQQFYLDTFSPESYQQSQAALAQKERQSRPTAFWENEIRHNTHPAKVLEALQELRRRLMNGDPAVLSTLQQLMNEGDLAALLGRPQIRSLAIENHVEIETELQAICDFLSRHAQRSSAAAATLSERLHYLQHRRSERGSIYLGIPQSPRRHSLPPESKAGRILVIGGSITSVAPLLEELYIDYPREEVLHFDPNITSAQQILEYAEGKTIDGVIPVLYPTDAQKTAEAIRLSTRLILELSQNHTDFLVRQSALYTHIASWIATDEHQMTEPSLRCLLGGLIQQVLAIYETYRLNAQLEGVAAQVITQDLQILFAAADNRQMRALASELLNNQRIAWIFDTERFSSNPGIRALAFRGLAAAFPASASNRVSSQAREFISSTVFQILMVLTETQGTVFLDPSLEVQLEQIQLALNVLRVEATLADPRTAPYHLELAVQALQKLLDGEVLTLSFLADSPLVRWRALKIFRDCYREVQNSIENTNGKSRQLLSVLEATMVERFNGLANRSNGAALVLPTQWKRYADLTAARLTQSLREIGAGSGNPGPFEEQKLGAAQKIWIEFLMGPLLRPGQSLQQRFAPILAPGKELPADFTLDKVGNISWDKLLAAPFIPAAGELGRLLLFDRNARIFDGLHGTEYGKGSPIAALARNFAYSYDSFYYTSLRVRSLTGRVQHGLRRLLGLGRPTATDHTAKPTEARNDRWQELFELRRQLRQGSTEAFSKVQRWIETGDFIRELESTRDATIATEMLRILEFAANTLENGRAQRELETQLNSDRVRELGMEMELDRAAIQTRYFERLEDFTALTQIQRETDLTDEQRRTIGIKIDVTLFELLKMLGHDAMATMAAEKLTRIHRNLPNHPYFSDFAKLLNDKRLAFSKDLLQKRPTMALEGSAGIAAVRIVSPDGHATLLGGLPTVLSEEQYIRVVRGGAGTNPAMRNLAGFTLLGSNEVESQLRALQFRAPNPPRVVR